MSGPFLGHFRLYLIDSSKVISSKVAKFGSMDIVELHGDILQPWGGQLETPGLVKRARTGNRFFCRNAHGTCANDII